MMLSHFSQVYEKHSETFLRRPKKVEKLITVHSCKWKFTIRKKMATDTFTYNALLPETLKERVKTQKNCKLFKLVKSNAFSKGTTAVKP